ncbi:MAG: secretin N-terminal domain-containing protein [bacterium]
MLDSKKGREKTQWRGFNRTIGFLAAGVIIFAASGVGPQEKASRAVLASSQEVISLNVTQMDLQDVLRLMAEKGNLNIIISKEVAGEISLRLKNVDLWQALGAILETNGFTYQEEKGIIRVVKLGETAQKKPMLVTEVIGLKYVEAEEMKKVSQHLLSASGTMEIDVRSNALVITDIPQNIEKIGGLVAKLDTGIPVFNLVGILFSPDHSLAMINNQILTTGERIGDFTVSEIGEDSVTLKQGDQTVTLKLREELRALEK